MKWTPSVCTGDRRRTGNSTVRLTVLQLTVMMLCLPNGQYSLLPTARGPRMGTCELSCVVLVGESQHKRQHMQFTRREEKLFKSRKTALGTFPKKVCEM